jgi:hypothetical protein
MQIQLTEQFKKVVAIILVCVVVLLAGYGLGRFTGPVKVVESEKIVYKEKLKVEAGTAKAETAKEVKKDNSKVKTHESSVTIKRPNGEVVIFREKDTESLKALESLKESLKNESSFSKLEKVSELDRTTKKETIFSKDNWLLSAKLGVDLGHLDFVQPASNLILGLEVQYRLVGPVWVGLGGNTQKQIFISGGVSF